MYMKEHVENSKCHGRGPDGFDVLKFSFSFNLPKIQFNTKTNLIQTSGDLKLGYFTKIVVNILSVASIL